MSWGTVLPHQVDSGVDAFAQDFLEDVVILRSFTMTRWAYYELAIEIVNNLRVVCKDYVRLKFHLGLSS